MARTGKYSEWITEAGLLRLEGWARDGLTDRQIAHNAGISEKTLNEWKLRFPQLSEALKRGKAPIDYEVENALLKSALGFYVTIKKPIRLKTTTYNADGSTTEEYRIEMVEEQKYIPPSVRAIIFWLKNRRPDKWREREYIDTIVNGGGSGEDDLLTQSFREMAELLNKKIS